MIKELSNPFRISIQAWEGRAYEYGMDNLRSMGYAVEGLSFDPDLVVNISLKQHQCSCCSFITLQVDTLCCAGNNYHWQLDHQVIRGLIMDKKNGNVVKADRFGYVKRAMHGTKMLSNRSIRFVAYF